MVETWKVDERQWEVTSILFQSKVKKYHQEYTFKCQIEQSEARSDMKKD